MAHASEEPGGPGDEDHRAACEGTPRERPDRAGGQARGELAQRRHSEQSERMNRQDTCEVTRRRGALKQRPARTEEERVPDAPHEQQRDEDRVRRAERERDQSNRHPDQRQQ